jgi:hypothetical protein
MLQVWDLPKTSKMCHTECPSVTKSIAPVDLDFLDGNWSINFRENRIHVGSLHAEDSSEHSSS